MNILSIAALALLAVLAGCMASYQTVQCIDAQFDREPRPLDKTHFIELVVDGESRSIEVTCEEYYDAMCSVRGNYWAIRRVGTESQYDHGSFLVEHPQFGLLEVPVPSCSDLTLQQEISLDHLVISTDGENKYWLKESNGDNRTYTSWNHGTKPGDTMRFSMSMTVNGQPVR